MDYFLCHIPARNVHSLQFINNQWQFLKNQVIAMYVPDHVWYGAAIKAFSNMLV